MNSRRNLIVTGGPPGGHWAFHPSARDEIANASMIDPPLGADLRPKLRRLGNGDGRIRDEVKFPLATAPELGEVRFFIQGRHYRLFFAEPHDHPLVIVALKFWRKAGRDEEIKHRQNAAIAEAAVRLAEWKNANAGSL